MKKMNFLKPLFCLALISSMALTSCARYQATPLSHPDNVVTSSVAQSSDVVVCAKRFNQCDCKKYLDRDVIRYGYIPVQVYIQNNSDKDYLFSLNRVSVPCANPKEVAQKVHTSTVGRAVGYSTAALLTCGLFFIPAVVDGVMSSNANQALDQDFAVKTAHDQVIGRYSNANMLMFVPARSFQSSFSVTLLDQATGQPKTFQVSA